MFELKTMLRDYLATAFFLYAQDNNTIKEDNLKSLLDSVGLAIPDDNSSQDKGPFSYNDFETVIDKILDQTAEEENYELNFHRMLGSTKTCASTNTNDFMTASVSKSLSTYTNISDDDLKDLLREIDPDSTGTVNPAVLSEKLLKASYNM